MPVSETHRHLFAMVISGAVNLKDYVMQPSRYDGVIVAPKKNTPAH
jgi:hypothetical protein